MNALASQDFVHPSGTEKQTTSIPLFIPFSLIPLIETGPLSNITIVVQEKAFYGEGEGSTIFTYPTYPYDNGKYHPNPLKGVSSCALMDFLNVYLFRLTESMTHTLDGR